MCRLIGLHPKYIPNTLTTNALFNVSIKRQRQDKLFIPWLLLQAPEAISNQFEHVLSPSRSGNPSKAYKQALISESAHALIQASSPGHLSVQTSG